MTAIRQRPTLKTRLPRRMAPRIREAPAVEVMRQPVTVGTECREILDRVVLRIPVAMMNV
jgi:hypothetical protein